jgi:hypothetical protein
MLSIVYSQNPTPANETPCSPISQFSDTLLPVEATEIVAFRENYTQPAKDAQSWRILKWLIATGLAISK